MHSCEAFRVAADLIRRLMDGDVLTTPLVMDLAGVKRAAAKRYLDTLAAVVPGIEVSPGRPTTYRLARLAPSPGGTAVLALALARAALPGLRESELDLQLCQLQKDQLALAPAGAAMADLGRRFLPRHRLMTESGSHADTVDVLVRALSESRKVSAVYQHFGPVGGDPCTLLPYSLIPTDSGLFCYAFVEDSQRDHMLQAERMFKIARMTEVRLLDEHFAYPPADAYNPDGLFTHNFGVFVSRDQACETIELEFAPGWAGYLACEKVHASQVAPVQLSDGWQAVSLQVRITLDFVQWVRGLGQEVRTRTPQLLIDWVASGEGAGFLASYRST